MSLLEITPLLRSSVTLAVFVFLYCTAALLLYVGYTNLYRDSRKLTMTDFIITIAVTFLWLVSTSTWATALTDINTATGSNATQGLKTSNVQGGTCQSVSVTSVGSLNVCDLWLSEYDTLGRKCMVCVQGDQLSQSIKHFYFSRRYSSSNWNTN